jgi:hypothetical protein
MMHEPPRFCIVDVMARAWWLAVALVVGMSAQAFAQSAGDAYAAGQKAYAAHDYLGAAKHFTTAYALEPDPAYLFNIAQSYRLGNDCKNAAEYYQRYLDSAQDPPNAGDVRSKLEEQRACAKQRDARAAVPPPSPRPAVEPERSRSPLRTYALVSGAVGVAALGSGLGFSWYGRDLEKQRDDKCNLASPCEEATFESFEARGKRANTFAYVSYGLAGAALVGAGVLWFLGKEPASEQRLAVTPSPDGVTVTARLRF